TIEPLVRERAFFTCDIGSPKSALTARWPRISFGIIAEVWWPSLDETDDQVRERGRAFREKIVREGDWSGTLVVTHWGFIKALTGETVTNGTALSFDPHGGTFGPLER
ncbi:MAG: histidine phosphatase family protein, partial [Kiloniellales bacterium]|nr:histidine phosphatase family protein [Kiloniellales bacterium]